MHGTPDATTAPRPGATFHWIDGVGHPWNIHATPTQLTLTGGDDIHVIAREAWREAITFTPSSGSVVLHIDLGDREIGFLVPMADARALFVSMGQGVGQARPATPPTQPDSDATAEAQPVDAALWPKMNACAVAAVSLAALAFIPIYGLALGIAAMVFAGMALRGSRGNVAHRHIRIAGKTAVYGAAAGMAVSLLAWYTMWRVTNTPPEFVQAPSRNLDYKWSAQVAAIIMILIGLSVHEAAHAITAWWCGDGYAKSLGRVTLNPLAHIDPFGTVLLPMMLMYMGAPVFGYARPVPVRLDGVRHRNRAQILVAAAGPASNLLQAALCMALLTLMGAVLVLIPGASVRDFTSVTPTVVIAGVPGAAVLSAVALMLKIGVLVNVLLAFFNLIPIPPLDGSWILQYLFPSTLGPIYARLRPFGFLLFLALFYMPGDLFYYLMRPGAEILRLCRQLLIQVTGFA